MEGSAAHALAEKLGDALSGHPVERINVPEGRWQANVVLHNCVGQVIQRGRAHGRWVFLDFSHGITWGTQMIAKSAWTVRAAGETDRVLPGLPMVSVILRSGTKAVLTGRPVFLILPSETMGEHAEFKSLGPDPLVSAAYETEFAQRLRRSPGKTVASALLDQEIVAGLGNPMKCEVLFGAGIAPGARVGGLMSSGVEKLVEVVAQVYREAAGAVKRGEKFDYAVYDRAGEPCPKCGGDIAVDRSGGDGHHTWFCPVCQKGKVEAGLFGG